MPFSEELKAKIRRKAAYRCCVCQKQFVEIHHIIPQAAGGSDDEDNAAPLCANCHSDYGGNPELRKKIREIRDHWYSVAEVKFPTQDNIPLETLQAEIPKEPELPELDGFDNAVLLHLVVNHHARYVDRVSNEMGEPAYKILRSLDKLETHGEIEKRLNPHSGLYEYTASARGRARCVPPYRG
jgi:hypothetical protein